jgi:hypothetical protein
MSVMVLLYPQQKTYIFKSLTELMPLEIGMSKAESIQLHYLQHGFGPLIQKVVQAKWKADIREWLLRMSFKSGIELVATGET